MRVLVEPAIFRYGRCGLTRYYMALCEGLAELGIDVHVPLLFSHCDYQPGIARYTQHLAGIPKVAGILDRLTTMLFHFRIRHGRFDCVIATSPSFDAAFWRLNPHLPFLMVVHDLMTCVTSPDGLHDAAGPALLNLFYLAARATKIICISDDTRRALVRSGGFDANDICVIKTGNLLPASKPLEISAVVPSRFLLFVGERSGRKNFFSVARAFRRLIERDPEIHLVCTGRFSPAEMDYLERLGICRRVMAMEAPDGVLVHLYRNALCLVYPSMYEGFGLPVLEAMHYGCPVITTTCGGLGEIAGDAALFIDPEDEAQLIAAIDSLLSSAGLRDHYRRLGIAQAARFPVSGMMQSFRQELLSLSRAAIGA